jgi:protein-L-isoaspartate O-methyltransferase
MPPEVPERVRYAVELLDVQPANDILEIGSGPGHAIALVCARLRTGTITAIDRSAIAVERARARNAACIAAGRARIEMHELTVADLGRRFAKIFAINVNAFWTAPAPSLAALARLLSDRGRAYLVYEPPSTTRLRDLRQSLTALLEDHDFRVIDVRTRSFRTSQGLAIVADRS